MEHRHFNSRWVVEEQTEKQVNQDARSKFFDACECTQMAQLYLNETMDRITILQTSIGGMMRTVSNLSQSYAELALGGSFSEQIAKSIRLLETTLESLRNDPSLDHVVVETAEKDLAIMQAKENFLTQVVARNPIQVIKRPALQPTINRGEVEASTDVEPTNMPMISSEQITMQSDAASPATDNDLNETLAAMERTNLGS